MTKYLFALLLIASSQLQAEPLSDPTRPPPGVGADSSSLVPGLLSAYPKVRGLQSVMISPTYCAAIIDGQIITIGAMHGKERLVDISERGVVLQGENGRRTLTLFPAVGIRQAEAWSPDTRGSKCHMEQNKHAKNPAKQAGQQKEKK